MDAIAQPRAAVPEPPGFFASLWDVFVAFLLAGIGVAAAAFAAILIGAFGFTAGAERPDPIDWPYPHAGPWSVAANVVATVAVLLLCAVAISRRLARRAGEPVSWLRVFGIVAVTGYAPFAAYQGLVPLHFFLGWIATALLARWLATGVEPPHMSGRMRAGLIAGGAALLCIPASYGSTHPLWYGSYVGGPERARWEEHRVVYTARHPRTFAYVFFLHNVSWGRVTLLGVSGTDTASFLRVGRAEPGFLYPGRTARPLPGVSIHHQNEQELTLYIHTPGCAGLHGTFSLDRVHVRYRLAGVTLSQPVPLATRPTVVCP